MNYFRIWNFKNYWCSFWIILERIEILTSQIIFDQYRETCRENSIHTEQIPYTNSENHFFRDTELSRKMPRKSEISWNLLRTFETKILRKKKIATSKWQLLFQFGKETQRCWIRTFFTFFVLQKIHFVCIQIQFKCQFKIGNCS